MSTKQRLQTIAPASWFTTPQPDHIVHFYPLDDALLVALTEYFSKGLRAGDTCIAIATPSHLASLNAALRSSGIDVSGAIDDGQYIMFDANDMLATFMVAGQPNRARFMNHIGRAISLAAGRERPVRAFGEMVSILWENGNLNGLLELEKYWHTLVAEQSFSLYCAYPEALFTRSSSHQEAVHKICDCHSLTLGAAV